MDEKSVFSKESFMDFYSKYMVVIGSLGHCSFLLQTRTILANESSRNVSLEACALSFFTIASWLLYGYLVQDKAVFRTNLFGFTAGAICLAAILYYK